MPAAQPNGGAAFRHLPKVGPTLRASPPFGGGAASGKVPKVGPLTLASPPPKQPHEPRPNAPRAVMGTTVS